MTNRRIEVWIDTEDLTQYQFDYLRLSIETTCWNKLKTLSSKGRVQANEVDSPHNR